jgi:hypothetical protein
MLSRVRCCGHTDAGFPRPGQLGWQTISVSSAIELVPPGSARRRWAGLPVTGPPAQEAALAGHPGTAWPLCRRTWPVLSPAAIRRGGVPGEGWLAIYL